MRSLIVFIITLITSPLYGQAKAVITAPEKGALGDLIILSSEDSEGDVKRWNLVNSDKTYFELDGKCIFASGTPGEYIFFLTVADYDSGLEEVTLDTAIHKIVIGNPAPTPNPGPSPGPDEPDPGPSPTPVNPEPNLTGISKKCFDSMKGVEVRSGEVAKLAKNLRNIAAKAAGLSWTPRQMNSELARLNTDFNNDETKARWKPWIECFNDTLSDATTDRLKATEGFIAHAEGLEAFDKWKPATSMWTSDNVPVKGSRPSLTDQVKQIRNGLNTLSEEIGK